MSKRNPPSAFGMPMVDLLIGSFLMSVVLLLLEPEGRASASVAAHGLTLSARQAYLNVEILGRNGTARSWQPQSPLRRAGPGVLSYYGAAGEVSGFVVFAEPLTGVDTLTITVDGSLCPAVSTLQVRRAQAFRARVSC